MMIREEEALPLHFILSFFMVKTTTAFPYTLCHQAHTAENIFTNNQIFGESMH